MQAAPEKYHRYTKGALPSLSESNGWLGADLMIKGLEGAGPNPTASGL